MKSETSAFYHPFEEKNRKNRLKSVKPYYIFRTVEKGNTEGKTNMSKEECAYIAGFLDGDGCVMLQLVYRDDYILGYQIRASVVFYQKQQHRSFLSWLQQQFQGIGYIRNRNDGMSEYTIVGITDVRDVLTVLLPYLRLKKPQAKIALKVIKQMPGSGRKMTKEKLLDLAKEVDRFIELNYSKRRTNTSAKVREFFEHPNHI